MSLEKAAFDHIVSKLDSQRTDLANIRNQAQTSAAVTGLLGAVFAGVLSSQDFLSVFFGNFFLGFSLPALLLLVLVASSIALSTLVLTSRDSFTFSFDANKMISRRKECQTDEDLYAAYSRDGEWFFRDNEKKIELVQWKLWWSTVLGWSQIMPWSMLMLEASR